MFSVPINQTGSTDIVAAVPNKKIRVTSMLLIPAAAETLTINSGTAPTGLTGAMSLAAKVPIVLPFAPSIHGEHRGYFETLPGDKLTFTQAGSVQLSGTLTYELVN